MHPYVKQMLLYLAGEGTSKHDILFLNDQIILIHRIAGEYPTVKQLKKN